MTRNETIAVVKHAGYSLVLTAAGSVPIENWNPYGATRDDARTFSVAVTGWNFIADDDRPRIEDMTREGKAGGVWLVGPRPADCQQTIK